MVAAQVCAGPIGQQAIQGILVARDPTESGDFMLDPRHGLGGVAAVP